MVWKLHVLIIGTLILTFISRASLLHPRTHGFHRFFAWEAIFALFLMNVEFWFVKPFSWYQVIAWILLFCSIIPLIWGMILLRKSGKPLEKRASDPSLLAFEKTSTLVKAGIYRYIRHPLYSSLLLLAWGIFFKSPSIPGGILVAFATLFLNSTARFEERENFEFFGEQYRDYMTTTKRFIPFVF
jgi:protein-S-isoprenylcysteine O-methyltransferase Ste14